MNIIDTRANNTFNFVKRKNIKNIPLFEISFLDNSMDISGYTDVIFQSTPSVEFFNPVSYTHLTLPTTPYV